MMARGGVRYIGLDGAGVERFDVEADVEYETWSRANAFTLETNGLAATAMGQPVPIGRIVVPKHWKNTVSVKLGSDVALVPDRWTLRAGVYYESAVAPPAYANVDFPGGPQLGAALGGSFLSDGGWELAVTYQLRYQPSVSVSEADARVYQQVPGQPLHGPLHRSEHLQRALPGTARAGRQRRDLRRGLAPGLAGVPLSVRRHPHPPREPAMKRRTTLLSIAALTLARHGRAGRRAALAERAGSGAGAVLADAHAAAKDGAEDQRGGHRRAGGQAHAGQAGPDGGRAALLGGAGLPAGAHRHRRAARRRADAVRARRAAQSLDGRGARQPGAGARGEPHLARRRAQGQRRAAHLVRAR